MKVKELINLLQKYDPDLPVCKSDQDGDIWEIGASNVNSRSGIWLLQDPSDPIGYNSGSFLHIG